jgi:hypothetical protein
VYQQHTQWYEFLPLAEFSYNNSRHTSTTFSPFQALYGFNPITPPNLISHIAPTTNWIDNINDIHALVNEQLKIAKTLQSHYANRKRIDRQFQVGDKVMLSTSHLKLRNQPSSKFRQRFIGPYAITKVISPVSYELQLPGTLSRIHPVFHISKLIATNVPEAPMDITPAAVEEANEFQVDSILEYKIDAFPTRYRQGPCLLFKVRWALPYTSQDDSWEPLVLLKNVDALQLFIRTNLMFQQEILTPEYKELHQRYPARFPLKFE